MPIPLLVNTFPTSAFTFFLSLYGPKITKSVNASNSFALPVPVDSCTRVTGFTLVFAMYVYPTVTSN